MPGDRRHFPDRWTDELGPARLSLRKRSGLEYQKAVGRSPGALIFTVIWLGLVAGGFVGGGLITVFPALQRRFGESSVAWVMLGTWLLFTSSTLWFLVRHPSRPSLVLHRDGLRVRPTGLLLPRWQVFPFHRLEQIRFGVRANWLRRELEKGKHVLARLNAYVLEAAIASERERSGTLVVRDVDHREFTFPGLWWQYEEPDLLELFEQLESEHPDLFAPEEEGHAETR